MKTQSGFVGTKRGCRRPMVHDRAATCRRVTSDPISKSFSVKFWHTHVIPSRNESHDRDIGPLQSLAVR